MNALYRTRTRIVRLGRVSVAAAVAALAVATCASPAAAQDLIYVDADDGFDTGNANLSPLSAINSSASARDNLWGFRNLGAAAAAGLPNTVFESGHSSPAPEGEPQDEDAQELTMTLRASDGLVSGQSYDVYIAYWSANGQNWTVQAGLSSGNYTMFNRTGPVMLTPVSTGVPTQVEFVPGTPATAAIWASPPADTSGVPILTQADRTMYLGKIGTATATGGQINLFINDLPTTAYEESLGTSSFIYRTWLDGAAFIETGFDIALRATIDRDTGEIVINNNTGKDVDFISYSLSSAVGGLDPNEWNRISATNAGWQVTAPAMPFPSAAGALSEAEEPAGSGITLADGDSLNLGDAWIATPFEDLQISLTRPDMSVLTVPITYSGTEIVLGDFNGTGAIDLDDLEHFRLNLHKDVSQLTPAESYFLGDFDGNLAINHADFVAFRNLYNAAHGAGAFEAAFGAVVPEPASIIVLAAGLLCALWRRARWPRAAAIPALAVNQVGRSVAGERNYRLYVAHQRGNNMNCLQRRCGTSLPALVVLFAALGVFAERAHGQIAYVDASSGNTTLVGGGAIAPTNNVASGTDGAWRSRPNLANAGTIFESGGDISTTGDALNGNNEDVPRWVTTITGLTPDSLYSAYVYFWSAGGNQNWPIQAGLTNVAGDLPLHARLPLAGSNPAPAAIAADFVAPAPIVTESDRTMYQGTLGVGKANSAGELAIYIDDHPSVRQDIEFGWNLRTWYDGVGFEEASVLTLRVNTTTGAMSILNNESETFDVNYYEIRSQGGSLNPDPLVWNSFAKQDGNVASPTTWRDAGGASDNVLSEFIFQGMKSFDTSDSATLGNAFRIGGDEDLTFWYGLTDDSLQPGFVEYVSGGPAPGDFNGDGVVDAADYTRWRDSGGSPGEFQQWKSNFGATAGSGSVAHVAAAVPEPGTIALVWLVSCCGLLARRGRGLVL